VTSGQTDNASKPVNEEESFPRVGEGLCYDAAILLEELHFYHADSFFDGSREVAKASAYAIARSKHTPLASIVTNRDDSLDAIDSSSAAAAYAAMSRLDEGPRDPASCEYGLLAAHASQAAQIANARLAPDFGSYPSAYGGIGGVLASHPPALDQAGLLCAGSSNSSSIDPIRSASVSMPPMSGAGGSTASAAGTGALQRSASEKDGSKPSLMQSIRFRNQVSRELRRFDNASSLHMMLPPSLVSLLRKRGAKVFCRVFNSKLHASSDALWSGDMRRTLMRQLRRNLAPLLGWVKHQELARRRLHPAAPLSALPDPRDGTGLAGLPSLSGTGRLPSPWDCGAFQVASSARPITSGGHMLAYPSVQHVPAPRRVRFPQLDDEPRVANVYLRVYVGGAPLPCSSRQFVHALFRGLHEEVAALAAAHLTLVEGTLDAAARLAGVEVKGAATVKARNTTASSSTTLDLLPSKTQYGGGRMIAGSAAHRDGGAAVT